MRQRDKLGLGRQQARQRGEVDAAVARDRQHVELDARRRAQQLPRHDVGMVLDLRQQDAVARLQQRAAE